MKPKLSIEIKDVGEFEQIYWPRYIWFNPEAKELPEAKVIHIRSWYPAWIVKLKIRYVLWKNKKVNADNSAVNSAEIAE